MKSTPYQRLRNYTLLTLEALIVGTSAVVMFSAPYYSSGGGWPLVAFLVAMGALMATTAVLCWYAIMRQLETRVENADAGNGATAVRQRGIRSLPARLTALDSPELARGTVRAIAVVHTVAVLTLIGLALVSTPVRYDPLRFAESPLVLTWIGIMAVLPLAGAAGMWSLTAYSAVIGLGVTGIIAHNSSFDFALSRAGLVFIVAALMLSSVRMSVWYVELAKQEVESSRLRADLVVAEERLRFSRDLHDVFGRTLTAVAVKSDLAAEFAENGRSEDAVDEMRAVHALAQEALVEVRGVVAGYRAPSLATELAGSRALLESSGIKVRVLGEADEATPSVAETLAWVLREAVTNVIRHSSAGACVIRVSRTSLEVENDGVAPGTSMGQGSGLSGLRDRLAAVNGSLEATRRGSSFVLRASIDDPGGERA